MPRQRNTPTPQPSLSQAASSSSTQVPLPTQVSSSASTQVPSLPPWSQAPLPAPIQDPSSAFASADTVQKASMSNQDAQRLHAPLSTVPDSAPSSQSTAQVANTPIYQPNHSWSLSQNALLFNIALERAKFEFTHCKRKAEAELLEMSTSAVVHRPKPISERREDEDYTGEIPQEVKAFASQFAGLLQAEIAKIFANRFRPMNLYKLRHMKGRDDLYREQIYVEEGALRMRKVTESYKDYGADNTLWYEASLNYASIVVFLFGTTSPTLHLALANFHRDIIDLSIVYKWQPGVLPLALDLHTHIVEGHPTDPHKGEIQAKWQARFCNPHTVLGSHPESSTHKRKRGSSPTPASKKDANDNSVLCNFFNKVICSQPNCHRKHACETCGSKDHGSRTCKRTAEVHQARNRNLMWEAQSM